jgi:hypothetical protein
MKSLILNGKNISGRMFYFSVLRIMKELCVITFTLSLIIIIIVIVIWVLLLTFNQLEGRGEKKAFSTLPHDLTSVSRFATARTPFSVIH